MWRVFSSVTCCWVTAVGSWVRCPEGGYRGEGEKLAKGSSEDHLNVSRAWLLVPLPHVIIITFLGC